MGPEEIGSALGQAQDVQQVLGIVIAVLIAALLAIVTYYLREKGAWTKEQVELAKEQTRELGVKETAAESARADWERERALFIQRERDLIKEHATKSEELWREMIELTLGVERALDQLGRRGAGPGAEPARP